jgi:hypothetical protein
MLRVARALADIDGLEKVSSEHVQRASEWVLEPISALGGIFA